MPFPDSPDWDPKARGEKVNDSPKHFTDNVKYMDKLVGKVLDKLDALGIRSNTLVFYAGDNGTQMGISTLMADGTQILGGKGLSTDAGTRVPLMVSWPGVISPGTAGASLYRPMVALRKHYQIDNFFNCSVALPLQSRLAAGEAGLGWRIWPILTGK